MKIVGIDPGMSPALAFLTAPDKGARVLRIPEGHHAPNEVVLTRELREEAPDVAYVEIMTPMTGQGAASTAHLMTSWGIIRGVLRGLGIPYEMVAPTVWKEEMLSEAELGRHILDPTKRKAHQKASAVAFVRRIRPSVNLIPARCRNPDHNLAEAVCIAEYGIKVYAA